MCGPSGSTMLSHKRHDFRKNVIEGKMCLLIFCTNFVRNPSHSKNSPTYYTYIFRCLRVKYPYFCRILMKPEFSRQIFAKYPNIEFHKNPANGSRDFPCGRTDRQTHMTYLMVAKTDLMYLMVAFRNFAKAPESLWRQLCITPCCSVNVCTRVELWFTSKRNFFQVFLMIVYQMSELTT
jgi:hypothetical protein